MTFQVGEKVVYPNHGVGTIENISSRSFGTQAEKFYLLRLSYNSLTVMVPFSHVDQVGLRKVTKNGEITKVLNYLACAESNGLRLVEIVDDLGICHSLLRFVRSDSRRI